MSKEKNLQSAFDEACNYIHKIVGEYVNMDRCQRILSKHEDRDGYLISLKAPCRKPGCKYSVISTISTTEEQWSTTLIKYFIQRAEFHAKSQHRIITEFKEIPNTPYTPKQRKGH